MEIREHWIEDTLNDIKNIIYAEGQDCDYETLIGYVLDKKEEIDALLKSAKSEEKQRLKKLEERAELYLNTLNTIKKNKQKAEGAQPGNE